MQDRQPEGSTWEKAYRHRNESARGGVVIGRGLDQRGRQEALTILRDLVAELPRRSRLDQRELGARASNRP